MTLGEFALAHTSIEVNIAKLSVLISRFLTGLCQGQMSPSTQEVYFHALEEWAANLPHNLRHFPGVDDPHSSRCDEVGSVSIARRRVRGKLTVQALP
jgi:hypothetical protein